VSILVRLVDVIPEEKVLWEESFERAMTDVLVMYSDIARTITSEIKVELSSDEDARLTTSRQVNPETYQAFLKGMYNLNKGTPEEFQQGMAYFQQAVEKNPNDPLAFAGLAFGYVTLGHNPLGPGDAWPKASAAANSALRLDPNLAEAHAALADCKLYGEWDFEAAEQGFLHVNELNPNLAMNHYHYSWYLALMGRMEEAIFEHQRAKELDPFEPLHTAWLGWLYYWEGEFDKAMVEAQEAIELNPNYPTAHWILAEVYAQKGMHEEAIAAVKKAAELAPPIFGWAVGRIYALIGQTEEAQKILEELETQEVTPWATMTMASLNGTLGNMDEAFRWLEKGYEIRTAWLPWIRVEALFEPHRKDPRIHELVKRMNLPPID
jgi:tetratricopeptide (TPR) repeat protein